MVVLSKEDYVMETECQLSNVTSYKKLNKDPPPTFAAEIKDFVTFMFNRGLTDKSTKDLLVRHLPTIAGLYLLPKLHKTDIPGRPI